MKILVIGAKGFIGSHLVHYYEQQVGTQVWSCDVVTDYAAQNYYLIDASNSDFNEVFQSQAFDVCINCSGAANVSDSLVHPKRDFMLNTQNVFYVLDAIRQHQPNCRYIQLSSAAVYGNPASLPISENAALSPISPYGWHKLQAEMLCKEFYEIFGIRTACLRIFSVYGPGLKKQLLWDLFNRLKQNKLELFGTGQETRDFIYIDDLVSAIDLIVRHSPFSNTIYNVANGDQIRVSDIANLVLKCVNSDQKFEFNGKVREGDPINWLSDVSKITSIGYKSKVSIKQGVDNYYKWICNNL